MIVKFPENPLMTEAVQWCGDNADEIAQFTGESVVVTGDKLTIKTSDRDREIDKGEWIIRRVAGGFARCKQDMVKIAESFKIAEWLRNEDAT